MATVFKRKRSKSYYFQYFDAGGKRVTRSAKTTDKQAAKRIAAKHEAEAALRRDGVIDPTLDAISRESRRSIDSHLADYVAKLRAAQRSVGHVDRNEQIIRDVCQWCTFATAGDISAAKVNQFANHLRDRGLAARTIQAHLQAMTSFTKWLADGHKLPRNPLSSIRKPNPKKDRRHRRRMLLPEEWRLLKAAAISGPVHCGMSGAERAVLYETALQTGLRQGELRALTRGNLYLDADPPFVTCSDSATKNRQLARQYIRPKLVELLAAAIATKMPRRPLFDMPHRTALAGMVRRDLAAAREAWLHEVRSDAQELARRTDSDFLAAVNHEGERIDFHCLRHTCGAWLAKRGVHPKVIQSVMRHGSITLTLDTYGHLFPGDEADAVARFDEMLASADVELAATGTDELPVSRSGSVSTCVSTQGAFPCKSLPDVATTEKGDDGGEGSRKSPQSNDLPGENEWPRRGSNPHEGYPSQDFKSREKRENTVETSVFRAGVSTCVSTPDEANPKTDSDSLLQSAPRIVQAAWPELSTSTQTAILDRIRGELGSAWWKHQLNEHA